jgi:hypothetical protein
MPQRGGPDTHSNNRGHSRVISPEGWKVIKDTILLLWIRYDHDQAA